MSETADCTMMTSTPRRGITLGLTLLLTACSQTPASSAATQQTATHLPLATQVAAFPLPAATQHTQDRLREWQRLTAPHADAPAEDYARFMHAYPHWPLQTRLSYRYQHALADSTPTETLSSLCPQLPLTYVPAFLRCRPYLPNAAQSARALWVHHVTTPHDEALLIAAFGRDFTPQDQWARFNRLIATHHYNVARHQISRLPASRRPVAEARRAFHLSVPTAENSLLGLSAADRQDPDLVLAELHALRRADRLGDAVALWRETGFSVQRRAPSAHWTNERVSLARALLSAGSPQDALLIAHDNTMPPASAARMESQFLTGWIKLRVLHTPGDAVADFTYLLQGNSIVTQSRGAYWLGRAHKALGHEKTARAAWQRAAAMPTTFYGQLALAALNGNAQTLPPDGQPTPGLAEALATLPPIAPGNLARSDLAQAAVLLANQGDLKDARYFLMTLKSRIKNPHDLAGLALLSLKLSLREPAVFAARAAGVEGATLYPSGWPRLPLMDESADGSLPGGLALGVARQESSFNASIESPAKAIGLMQLRLGTAHDVARHAGLKGLTISSAGLRDPETNMILGRAYLTDLLARFQNITPAALAAYNAGPHRAHQWLQADPLPEKPDQATLIDWIEMLPFSETRAYIQHVEENRALYRLQEQHHA